jgi:hypothetical protein
MLIAAALAPLTRPSDAFGCSPKIELRQNSGY